MKDVKEILDRSRDTADIIADLSVKSVSPPSWDTMKRVLLPHLHKIVSDTNQRRDRVLEDGQTVEKAARMFLGLEKLLAKRVNQFTFTIPVKREYGNLDNSDRKAIAKAIERIYQEADIDTVNMERGKAYYGACEVFTLWYVVKKSHGLYGFKSEYKLKCQIFSPWEDDVKLYPLLDEYNDMIAMSYEYTKKVGDEDVTFFETFGGGKHFKWSKKGNENWKDEIAYTDGEGNVTYGDDIAIMKIPGVYAWRKHPIYDEGTPELREDAEYKHSEDSDILAYNIAPLIKVVGKMIGDEKKYETRRLIRVESGGDVQYVQWSGAHDANSAHIQRDIDWFWMINQMPDISFRNLMSLGNIGYDARQMMLTDSYLKIGEESRPLLQMFRRECNVIKEFLKFLNRRWSEEDIDAVTVKHVITPYIPKDEQLEINKRMTANGGKPLESQRESILRYGKSADVEATINEIDQERDKLVKQQMEANMAAMLSQTQVPTQ